MVIRTRVSSGRAFAGAVLLPLALLMSNPAFCGTNTFTTSGPEGGTVLSIAVNGSNGTMFVGTGERIYAQTGGGIFLRPPGAPAWERSGLVGLGVRSVRVSPKDANVMWAVTSAGLYCSGDAGTTWMAISLTGYSTQPIQVAPDPNDANAAFLSTSELVWRTGDGGRTWAYKGQGLPVNGSLGILEFDVKTGTLYAGTTAGVAPGKNLFSSVNGGDSWNPVTTPAPANPIGAFTVDPTRPATLFLSLIQGSLPSASYRSTDGGSTWAQMGLTQFQSVAVSPQDAHTLFATNQGRVFKSTDDGNTFAATSDLLFPGQDFPLLAAGPNGEIYAGGYRGMFRSVDGGATWRPFVEGFAATEVCSITVDPTSPNRLYAGTRTGLFASTDGGASWGTPMGPSDPNNGPLPVCNLVVDPTDPSALVATTDGGYGTVYRSTDGGLTWIMGSQFGDVVGLASDPGAPATIYLAGNASFDPSRPSVLKSEDRGITWTATAFPGAGPFITAFLVAAGSPTTLIVGTNGHVFVSIDGGSSWADRPIGFEVDAIAADPSRPGWIYAAGTGGVAFSADWGLSWTPRNQGLPPLGTFSISALALDPSAPASLFATLRLPPSASCAVSGPAVFRSGDGGLTWAPFSAGLVNPEGTALVADKSRVAVGTPGNGLWLLTFGGVPRVDSVSPTSGSTNGGTLVLVKGDGFRSDSVVRIGGPTTELTFFDAQTIRVRTGAHSAGSADVLVANPDGSTASIPNAFQYQNWIDSEGGVAASSTLYLEDGRFWVDVDWSDPARGLAGKGHPVTLTLKSGQFWFDWNQNPQVVVKILDGRTQNGHYWIHVAALTDLDFVVHITDVVAGKTRTYHNPAGQTTAVLDRGSF